MNRRGFLKMVAGGAAAVTALALPHAMPQETETAVLPDSLASIEPIGGASPVDFGPWNRVEPYAIKMAGPSQAFPNYDEELRLARAGLSDEEYYRLSPQDELSAISRLAKRWAMTPTQVREFIGEVGTPTMILYGEHIKPSADLVDW